MSLTKGWAIVVTGEGGDLKQDGRKCLEGSCLLVRLL